MADSKLFLSSEDIPSDEEALSLSSPGTSPRAIALFCILNQSDNLIRNCEENQVVTSFRLRKP